MVPRRCPITLKIPHAMAVPWDMVGDTDTRTITPAIGSNRDISPKASREDGINRAIRDMRRR